MHPASRTNTQAGKTGAAHRGGGTRLTGAVLEGGWVLMLAGGCATPAIDNARGSFYRGDFASAERHLSSDDSIRGKDKVLYLMERGMVRQQLGQYDGSSKDFIEASDILQRLQTYSVSQGAASMVVNDNVQSFQGKPFERTLLHSFTALNHLSLGHWDNAGVEARRTIETLDPKTRGNYPDNPFSQYLAGFCLEMADDVPNAELQYRKTDALMPNLSISERGWISPVVSTNEPVAAAAPPDVPKAWNAQLVCFVLSGRSPTGRETWERSWQSSEHGYAEIYHQGRLLGRTYNLGDTVDLTFTTEQVEAAIKAVKTMTRVAIKEGVSQAVGSATDQVWGDLVRLVLIGMLEQPDTRRWETLPRWLQVARVPCPPDLDEFDLVLKSPYGVTLRKVRVTRPITRRGRTLFSFYRDIPGAGSLASFPPPQGFVVEPSQDHN